MCNSKVDTIAGVEPNRKLVSKISKGKPKIKARELQKCPKEIHILFSSEIMAKQHCVWQIYGANYPTAFDLIKNFQIYRR